MGKSKKTSIVNPSSSIVATKPGKIKSNLKNPLMNTSQSTLHNFVKKSKSTDIRDKSSASSKESKHSPNTTKKQLQAPRKLETNHSTNKNMVGLNSEITVRTGSTKKSKKAFHLNNSQYNGNVSKSNGNSHSSVSSNISTLVSDKPVELKSKSKKRKQSESDRSTKQSLKPAGKHINSDIESSDCDTSPPPNKKGKLTNSISFGASASNQSHAMTEAASSSLKKLQRQASPIKSPKKHSPQKQASPDLFDPSQALTSTQNTAEHHSDYSSGEEFENGQELAEEEIEKQDQEQIERDEDEEEDEDMEKQDEDQIERDEDEEEDEDELMEDEREFEMKEQHISTEDHDNDGDWTKEQVAELFDKLKENGVLQKDRKSFRVCMKQIAWEGICGDLKPPRTKEQCAEKLEECMESVRSIRNLHEMMFAYDNFPIVRRRNPNMYPMGRFRADNIEKIKAEIKVTGANIMSVTKRMYEALDPDVRERDYIRPYDRKKQEEQNIRKQLACRASFDFYWEKYGSEDSVKKDLRAKYNNLKDSKRIKYIEKATKEYSDAMVSYNKTVRDISDQKPPNTRVSKEEWRLFLHGRRGMPVLVVKTAMALYQQYEMSEEEQNAVRTGTEVLLLYNAFTKSSKHQYYLQQFKEMQRKFTEEFESWLKTETDESYKKRAEIYLSDSVSNKTGVKKSKFKAPKPAKVPAPPKVKTISIAKKVASKVQEFEDSFVNSKMLASFKNEPQCPAITAKDVFRTVIISKDIPVADVTVRYGKLTKQDKERCMELARSNLESYKKDLKDYVQELTKEERKVYIGQNRIRFIRTFEGTDIFENGYSCDLYPPFKKQPKDEMEKTRKKSPKVPDEFVNTFSVIPLGSDEDKEVSEGTFLKRVPATSTPMPGVKTNKAKEDEGSEEENSKEEESRGEDENSREDEEGAEDESDEEEQVQSKPIFVWGNKVHHKKLLDTSNSSRSSASSALSDGKNSRRSPSKAAGSKPPPEQEPSSSDDSSSDSGEEHQSSKAAQSSEEEFDDDDDDDEIQNAYA